MFKNVNRSILKPEVMLLAALVCLKTSETEMKHRMILFGESHGKKNVSSWSFVLLLEG